MTLGGEEMVLIALIGLAAGSLGGLAGVGGSMIIIPGLALLLGFHTPGHDEQHLYMATAMVVNVLVSLPAASRHAKEGAVRWDLYRVILPAMVLAIVLGVLLGNLVHGERLKDALAAFIALYCVFNLVRVFMRQGDFREDQERASRWRLIVCAGVTGLISGLLGLGGGVVLVPMLQLVCRVRLRQAIGTTLAVMPASAVIGAVLKVATLGSHGQRMSDVLVLVLLLGPLSMLGGHLGAVLSHRLPLRVVRMLIFALLMIVALKLAGIF